ncbi:N-acetylmuramoyl-L-alanine amidase [Caldifermentibacillus hisashii]|uniref:N-acetylmuramoyl-L-alanine amidase n=1 Tax=Caldifermentibacillus hisashii TaxID=996558 RepID=A0ABU9K5V3_9BACI
MANSIVISSGHALYVRGASDIIDEVSEARKVVAQVVAYLKQLGVDVHEFHDNTSKTQNQNLSTIVNFHNAKNRELDVSIHFNSAARTSNPLGVEVLYYDQSGLAANVSQAIANASGLRNRGAKQRKELYFLRNTNKPAILIEVCFVNSTVDVDLYRKNFDAICRAIAETLSGKKLPQQAPKQTESLPKKISFYTGGYSGDNLKKIHSFLRDNGWWFTPERMNNGSIAFLVGEFTQGTEKANKMEQFLKQNGYWYEIR